MASSREVHLSDLPPEFAEQEAQNAQSGSWTQLLQSWADQQLSKGDTGILNEATPQFERTLIDIALKHTGGRRRDAANLLGWGRNTLTRKIKELGTSYAKNSDLEGD
jgi:two-component system, NtrC family, nitrogen regulation response regulator GlnG